MPRERRGLIFCRRRFDIRRIFDVHLSSSIFHVIAIYSSPVFFCRTLWRVLFVVLMWLLLQMRETFYGKGHALVAPSLENQALLEINVGKVGEAERLLIECLSIQKER